MEKEYYIEFKDHEGRNVYMTGDIMDMKIISEIYEITRICYVGVN